MSIQVTMPALGESVTEGTVTRWLKNVGDTVAVDEPLLEVSTDKVDTEIPAPVAGILLEIRAEVDATVPVGSVVAVIGEPGSAAPAPVAAQAAPVAPAPAPAPAQAAPVASTPAPATAAAPAAGTPILLPALGESVTEGTVTRWLKSVGDNVTADEPLLEVSTDKVDTEIPAPASGVLLSIDVPADATAPVGAVLGVIGSSAPAPAAPAPAAPAPAAPASAPVVSAPVAPAAPSAPIAPVSDAYVTPLVRKVAADLGVDLSTVAGTGVGGRIRKQDVEAAAARLAAPAVAAVAPAVVQAAPTAPAATAAPAAALRGRTEPLSRLRKVIAQRMVESLQVSAQLTSVAEVDVTSIVNLRNRNKRAFEDREGVGLSFMPFFLKGLVDVLKVHPVLNSTLDLAAGTVTYHDAEHLAIAVDTPRGLVVPVIRDAGDLSLAGLARKVADLAERTRAGQVSPDELSGGTFTLTNTGSRGALMDTPIINQPQVAILGLGQIVKRPVVITDADGNDVIAIRHMVFLSLTYDHRIVDGADAARFLTDLKARYEQGAFDL